MKLEFSWQITEKSSNAKFHENPFSDSQVVSRGQTERHDKAQTGKNEEANRHFSQFCVCTRKLMFKFYMYI
jgi:hypothetical protein